MTDDPTMTIEINEQVWRDLKQRAFKQLDAMSEEWRLGDDYEVVAALELAMQLLGTEPADDETAKRIFDEMAIIADILLMSANVTDATRPRLEAIRKTSRMFEEQRT